MNRVEAGSMAHLFVGSGGEVDEEVAGALVLWLGIQLPCHLSRSALEVAVAPEF